MTAKIGSRALGRTSIIAQPHFPAHRQTGHGQQVSAASGTEASGDECRAYGDPRAQPWFQRCRGQESTEADIRHEPPSLGQDFTASFAWSAFTRVAARALAASPNS